jgi:8-amino-7-oxononanoate synthase
MPDLASRLDALARDGLARRRRIVESAEGPHVMVDGRRYLAFCSNDYLDLARHPALVEAARRGAER